MAKIDVDVDEVMADVMLRDNTLCASVTGVHPTNTPRVLFMGIAKHSVLEVQT